MSARHPWEIDFRVNQIAASTTGTKKTVKDGFVGKIKLVGYAPAGKQVFVKNLNESMARDGHVRAQVVASKEGSKYHEYQMKIDLSKQDPRKYEVRLIVPPAQLVQAVPDPEVKMPDVAMPDTDPDPDPDPDGAAKDGEDRK